MAWYLVRRILQMIPVLFGVSLAVFSMSHLVPGDPVSVMLGDRATGEDVVRLRHQLGLDKPLAQQYIDFLWRAIHGDLGRSIRSGQPVTKEIIERLPSTLELALAAALLAILLGIAAGTLGAISSNRLIQTCIMIIALLGISTPTFFSGLVFILIFALWLNWLPVASDTGLVSLILPAVTLALPAAAVLARITRSSILEEFRHDYVRVAYAKGLPPHTVIVRHLLRNALIPVVTIVGLQFGGLMAGSVIVESVFARPGLGRYAVTAITTRDFPQIQGIVLVVALIYVMVNFVVDFLYTVLDPRINYR